MKIKNLGIKNYLLMGILFSVCVICMLFVGWQMSFATGTSPDDNVYANELEYTEDTNEEAKEELNEQDSSNNQERVLYFAGSGVSGSISRQTVNIDSCGIGDTYEISATLISPEDDEPYVLVNIYNFNEESPKETLTIERDVFYRFDDVILYGPAKIDATTGEIIREVIPITNEGDEKIKKAFNFSDYQFEYPIPTANEESALYNLLEFEFYGEEIFGGIVAGKGDGHDKVELSLSMYDGGVWKEFEILQFLKESDPTGILAWVFNTILFPDYPKFVESYELSSKSIIAGRPYFVDANGKMSIMISMDGTGATVNATPYAKVGFAFDHWELNGKVLEYGNSNVLPKPEQKTVEIGGKEYAYNAYELYACYRNANDCVVTFDSKGGSFVAAQTVHSGHLATEPVRPTKAGYKFVDWYTQDGEIFNFKTPVTESITLNAKWTGGPQNPPVIESGDGQTFEHGSDGLLTFTFDQHSYYFDSVKVDDFNIDAKCYAINNSSTSISLTAQYLNTLYPGEHAMTVVTDSGSATAKFNIHDSSYNPGGGEGGGNGGNNNIQSVANSIAQTGDSSQVWALIMLAFLFGSGLIVYVRLRKRPQK